MSVPLLPIADSTLLAEVTFFSASGSGCGSGGDTGVIGGVDLGDGLGRDGELNGNPSSSGSDVIVSESSAAV